MNPYESLYLAGNLFKEPLIRVRGFMQQVGLEKNDAEFPEPEDVLAFELEIMNWLVSKQLAAATEEEAEGWVASQAEFLKRHLLIWGPVCAADIEKAEGADFYRGVAALLAGFLDMERVQFHGVGPERIETLEEARRRYGHRRSWRGPTFDPGGEPEGSDKPNA